MNDFLAGCTAILIIVCVLYFIINSFRSVRKTKPAPASFGDAFETPKKGAKVTPIGGGRVVVEFGKLVEVMSVETAERAGYLKKKEEQQQDEIKSAFGVPLGKR